ncbi:DNA primase [Catellatospora methionotrophica]|uniref:DNA primase n=1 Tax=Catellatospora methionotrophica TaxID=121620 RepID=A0A8J3L8M8_9ACTN|nr:bifunctional DNA primase/polymerase [Catellatospora methionotrophica]GIG14270.1 DNA primase [Catellatospora methionotrophica]
MQSLMDNALNAAACGWAVFPLIPDAKAPAISAWESRATIDPDRIRRCWSSGPYNVGIATGPSGLVVVDLDKLKGGELPDPWADYVHGGEVLAELERRAGVAPVPTHVVATGRGGRHLYYRHPSGPDLRNTQGRLGPLVDTRANGGYIVGAGSVVDGRAYRTIATVPVAELPAWLCAGLVPAPLPAQAPVTVTVELGSDRAGRYLAAAIDAQVRHLEQATEGSRNHALYTSAVALGQLVAGGAVGPQEIESLLTQAACRIGLRPMETARTIASGLRAGARRPRTVAV